MGIPYCCEAQAVRRRHPGESHEGRQRRRPKRAVDEPTRYAVKARTEMVHRVFEVLREEAFQLSRNIGIESLTARGGLHGCISQMRSVVFPRAGPAARSTRTPRRRECVSLHYPTTAVVSLKPQSLDGPRPAKPI